MENDGDKAATSKTKYSAVIWHKRLSEASQFGAGEGFRDETCNLLHETTKFEGRPSVGGRPSVARPATQGEPQ
jgi:hypothetical protein